MDATTVAAIAVVVTILGGVFNFIFTMQRTNSTAVEDAKTAMLAALDLRVNSGAAAINARLSEILTSLNTRVDALNGRHDSLSASFYDYKAQVAVSYATLLHTRDMEQRFTRSVEAIDAKLDRLLEQGQRQ